jgi:intergrase/recombinase
MELTHEESPWLDTYGKSQVIDNELLKDYFSSPDRLYQFIPKDKKTERKEAARFLLIDYLYDNELIDSSISDAEDIYEY